MAQADLLVVGGGLTGSSLATVLGRSRALSGRRILVLEGRTGPNPRFAGELIHPTGVDVLDENGLLEPLRAAGGALVRGFAVDSTLIEPDERVLHLPYGEVPNARDHGFAIDHHHLVATLRDEARKVPGVELRTGVRVVDLVRHGDDGRVVGVRTEAGEEIRAPLTFVAEGRHSKLRGLLGIEEESRIVSYSAAVLVEEAALPSPGYGHIFLGAPGPILAYPIDERGGRSTVRMVIDVPSPLLEANKGNEALGRLLASDYAPCLPPPLRDAFVAALGARPPQVAANLDMHTRRCVGDGFALVGESGGCAHPLTAAGMTICLHDVRVLSEELGRASDDPRSIREALDRYEARRYRFFRAREILADAVYEVFLGADPGARAVRTGILRYWRSGLRGRAASMALLSGADSRLESFLGEYLRVAGHALVARPEPGGPRFGRVRGVLGKSADKARRVARLLWSN